MTSLNRLFSRYFIITITLVLVLMTLVSNFGASLFFKDFIRKRNDEKNERIVEVAELMVEDDSISTQAYPIILGMLSRQENVSITFLKDETEIYKSYVYRTGPGMIGKPVEKAEGEIDIIYLDYSFGDFTLKIGRAEDPLFDIANADFIRTLNILYSAAFVAAMIIAFFAAWILSKKFNRPIMLLKDNVNHISMNRFEKLRKSKTKAKELMELSDDIENLAAQMQKKENLRKRLSNDIVHELKTPIAVLSTNIEAILDGIYTADEERMSILLEQINRLTRLVNNLSDLTLLETEYGEMTYDLVDLSEVLDDLYTVYLPAAKERHINLKREIEEKIFFKGNKDRLLQVFVNILSNSLKYTDEGGEIIIRIYSKGNSIVCEFEDTGIGIDKKDQPFIFDRFYRGDKSRSRETGGSGIGLSIAKAVVGAHGGDIKVKSEKDTGTKISILFQKNNGKSS